jgi:methylenetetrahydrofolate dehydrogenase (NADP+)/methenyltetrahydrofolate cyclohydrolase
MVILLSGKEPAYKIKSDVSIKVSKLKKIGIIPNLALILIGDNPDSKRYVDLKAKQCREVDIIANIHQFTTTIPTPKLKSYIEKLNRDKNVHGILVQLPIPKRFEYIIDSINIEKDVDGLTSASLGRIMQGRDGYTPAGAEAVIEILSNYRIGIKNRHIAIIGASDILGKPLASILVNAGADVNLVPSYRNMAKYTKLANIIIIDVGRAKCLTANMLSKNSVIIDAGNNYIDGKLVGDVDFENVKEIVHAITPVPGGIGPILVAILIRNVVKAAMKRTN